MALSQATMRALARGAALYGAGEHWEAHEAWEDAWLVEEGETRLFLQGLIQVAAAMHKAFVQRQPASCEKLLASALGKLEGLPEELGGLRLEEFRAGARAAREHARRWAAGELAAFDRALTPRLLWRDDAAQPSR